MKPLFLPPRTCPGVGFVFFLAVFSLLPQSARADRGAPEAAWLPKSERLFEVASDVGSFSAESFAERSALGEASARSCSLARGDFSCRCVTIKTEAGTYRAERLSRRGSSVVAEQLSVQPEPSLQAADAPQDAYFVESWAVDEEGRHRLESVTVVRPSRSLSALTVRDIELSVPGSVSTLATLDKLRWHSDAPTGELIGKPEGEPQGCGAAWPRPSSARMYLEQARLEEGRWKFRGFEVAGIPAPVADFEAEAPGPVSGLLPPTLIVSDEALSLQASYLFADWGVAAEAVAAPTHWYGLGIGFLSRVDHVPFGPPSLADEAELVDAQLRWSPATSEGAAGVHPALLGDGFWGSPYAHFSTSLEFVGKDAFWGVDRFGRGAPFRSWRLSRAGVSLSSPEHLLSFRVLHTDGFDAWRPVEPAGEYDDEFFGADLLFTAHHEIGSNSRADFVAEHRSVVEEEDSTHATTLRAGAEYVLGSRGALYARPALRAWLQTGYDTEPSGIVTSTRSQLAATLELGASFRGRFESLTHRIAPGVLLARDLVGFSRGDVSSLDGESVLFVRESQFSLGALYLDQGFDLGSFSVEVPLALVFEGAGVEEAVETKPWGLGAAALRSGGAEIAMRAACPRLCDDLWWTASASATFGAFDLMYLTGNLWRGVLLPLTWRSAAEDGWALLHGFQGQESSFQAPASDDAHLAGIGWQRGRFATRLQGIYTGEQDGFGVSLGNTYTVSALGWQVGLHAAIGPDSDRWGVLVGLSPEL